MSAEVARQYGFRSSIDGPKTGYYDYADIDDDFISIHHFIKWYKFGFTRLFDNLSLEIRNDRITRKQAIDIIQARGIDVPLDDIRKFCEFVGISEVRFFEIAETFRNPVIWSFHNGIWKMDQFLIPDWKWI